MFFSEAVRNFYHHPSPVKLRSTDKEAYNTFESLDSIAEASIPPFYPHPLLRSGHLQTCATLFTSDDTQINYKRQILAAESPDGSDTGSFSIDIVASVGAQPDPTPSGTVLVEGNPEYFSPRTSFFTQEEFESWKDEETTPIVVVLHGLGGGSHEKYVRLALEPLVTPKDKGGLGYAALVVNARGCAWTKLTSNRMFNAMFTPDIRQVVKLVRIRFPKRPIMAMGFSLGANVLAHYLGEEGSNCPLHAAILLSSPHNMEACAKLMYMSFTGRQYSKFLANNLKELFERNFEVLRTNPAIDIEGVRKSVYPFEYDTACTAPVAGFRTGGEYYRASSSVDKLMKIQVPTLIVNGTDDPIALHEAFPEQEVQANPYIVYATTSIGGHLGWFEWDMSQWFPKPIKGFFSRMEKMEVVEKPVKEKFLGKADDKIGYRWHDNLLELFLLAWDVPDFST